MLARHGWLLAISILIPNVGGWVGALFMDITWYNTLNKAPITPPAWAFAPIWTVLYCLMGTSSFLVCLKEGGNAFPQISLYILQLVLNWAWTPIFFHYHQFLWSLVEITANDVLALMTIIAFYKVRPLAGILMVPYIVWMGLATYLDLYIYMYNKQA